VTSIFLAQKPLWNHGHPLLVFDHLQRLTNPGSNPCLPLCLPGLSRSVRLSELSTPLHLSPASHSCRPKSHQVPPRSDIWAGSSLLRMSRFPFPSTANQPTEFPKP
jgi:hypothetical protein